MATETHSFKNRKKTYYQKKHYQQDATTTELLQGLARSRKLLRAGKYMEHLDVQMLAPTKSKSERHDSTFLGASLPQSLIVVNAGILQGKDLFFAFGSGGDLTRQDATISCGRQ
eukprot:5820522-Amphidinium_carterae.1